MVRVGALPTTFAQAKGVGTSLRRKAPAEDRMQQCKGPPAPTCGTAGSLRGCEGGLREHRRDASRRVCRRPQARSLSGRHSPPWQRGPEQFRCDPPTGWPLGGGGQRHTLSPLKMITTSRWSF